MRLIVQPDEGAAPLVRAIRHARKSVDAVIFRLDLAPVEKALKSAVSRGVAVRASSRLRTAAVRRSCASWSTGCSKRASRSRAPTTTSSATTASGS